MTGSDPEVTSFDWKSLEVAVEELKLVFLVPFTPYKAVVRRRRQSQDRK